MTICDNCIHDDVCGLEGHLDEALTFCAHRSVDAQPMRSGYWVEHIDHRYDYDREQGDILAGVSYTCSVCGSPGHNSWQFCPNCGFIVNSE